MATLVIYIALAGTAVPWLHRMVVYPTVAACQAAAPGEVAAARQKYVVAAHACLTLPVTPQKPGGPPR